MLAPIPPFPEAVRALLPWPAVEYTRWADPEQVGSFFASSGFVIDAHRTEVLGIPFASAAAAVAAFRKLSGPWIAVFGHLEAAGLAERARELLEAHLLERSDPHPDGLALRAGYAVTHLRRAG